MQALAALVTKNKSACESFLDQGGMKRERERLSEQKTEQQRDREREQREGAERMCKESARVRE